MQRTSSVPMMLCITIMLSALTGIAGCVEQKSVPGTVIDNQQKTLVSPTSSIAGNLQGNNSDEFVIVRETLVATLQGELERIDAGLNHSSVLIAEYGFNSQNSSEILKEVNEYSPYIQSPIILNSDLIITAVASEEYQDIIGLDLSDQMHLNEVIRLKKPVMGSLIQTVEGFPATPISYPIMVNNSVIGVLSVLVEQNKIITDAILTADPGKRFEIIVIQPNGVILYGEEPFKAGSNVFTERSFSGYPSLVEMFYQIGKQKRGMETFSIPKFPMQGMVKKEAIWDTTGLYGGEWRVVVTRVSLDT